MSDRQQEVQRLRMACDLVIAMINSGLLKVRKSDSNNKAVQEVGRAIVQIYREIRDTPTISLLQKRK